MYVCVSVFSASLSLSLSLLTILNTYSLPLLDARLPSFSSYVMQDIHDITMRALVRLHQENDAKVAAVIAHFGPSSPSAAVGLPRCMDDALQPAAQHLRELT